MNETKIIKYINSLNFNKALNLFNELSETEKMDLIVAESNCSSNIVILGFITYLLMNDNSCFHHELAANALIQMCWLEGAYSLAYYHASEMVRIQPDVKNKEFMLFFNEIPEKPMPDDLALKLAKEILAIDSSCSIAKEIVEKLSD